MLTRHLAEVIAVTDTDKKKFPWLARATETQINHSYLFSKMPKVVLTAYTHDLRKYFLIPEGMFMTPKHKRQGFKRGEYHVEFV